MNPKDAREKLSLFPGTLPDKVFSALLDKGVAELYIIPTAIAAEHGLVIYETGAICEGVLKVLTGQESPNNFLAFIQKDVQIEEDNLEKLPELAYEIQTKLFDPVLPIFKSMGLSVKEGRVPPPPVKQEPAVEPRETGSARITQTPSNPTSLPLEEKNVRALVRIASGTTYSEQDLKNAFEELPQGLRQSISSVDTANAIQDIAKKYLLHVDQMAELASETGLVLLGLTHPADFIANLSRRLRLPEDKAREIARDISAQILVKVREALRVIHEAPPAPPVAPAPVVPKKLNLLDTSRPVPPANPPAALPVSVLPKTTTPYSTGATWNTGENILSKQAGGLRTAPVSPKLAAPTLPSTPVIRTGGQKEVVGPTGWKPLQNEVKRTDYEVGKDTTSSIPASRPVMPPIPQKLPTPISKPAPMAETKSRPNEMGVPLPTIKPQEEPKDFLEQKLQAPMGLPREEKRYTADPYREPLG